MEATVGGVINKFKIKERRYTLFFEDILANYFKECQTSGYGKEIRELGRTWAEDIYHVLTPKVLRRLPPVFALNTVIGRIWTQIGVLDKFKITKQGKHLKVQTKNEMLTRIIGKNEGSFGFYAGALSIFFKSRVKCIEADQNKKECNYLFQIEDQSISVKTKSKEIYNKLNRIGRTRGLSLKDALKKGILNIDAENKIRFRGRIILPIENTFVHLISNEGPLIERVSQISYDYFRELIQPEVALERRLVLLKTLLQTMGWGIVDIVIKSENEIIIEIHYPPCGLQLETENWDFLIRTILGYLWLIDKQFKIADVQKINKILKIKYSK